MRPGASARNALVAGGAALALLGLPSAAQASGTLDYSCIPNVVNSGSPIWAGSSTAESFPAVGSGKLLTVDLKSIARASSTTDADIAVELYGEEASGNLVAPLLASTTIAGASVVDDGPYHHYTANFAPATAAFLTAGQRYGIALRTADSAETVWGFVSSSQCAGGMLLGGGPPYGPLGGGAYDAGLVTYLGPANDDFANATTLSGASPTTGATTAGGSREDPDEPDHYTIGPGGDPDQWVGDHSVWFRWMALGSGPTTIDTCTANIDSILAVYTGDALASLQRVTDNNNDAACGGGFGSNVSFTADAGTTYDIAVGDAGGARENTFTLDVSAPANEAPTLTNPKPAPGAKIKDRTPKIRATIADSASELGGDDIVLVLDGREKHIFTYNATKDKLKFQTGKLKRGRHTVEITAEDEQALTGATEWSFRVKG